MISLSSKRLIYNCILKNKQYPFLIDTGATVSLLSKGIIDKLDLKCSRKYNGTLVGAGGSIDTNYICDEAVYINNKPITQFISADISHVQDSIRQQTGFTIQGIIGLPQLRMLNAQIKLSMDSMEIIFN